MESSKFVGVEGRVWQTLLCYDVARLGEILALYTELNALVVVDFSYHFLNRQRGSLAFGSGNLNLHGRNTPVYCGDAFSLDHLQSLKSPQQSLQGFFTSSEQLGIAAQG